jgi:hypothetical protein
MSLNILSCMSPHLSYMPNPSSSITLNRGLLDEVHKSSLCNRLSKIALNLSLLGSDTFLSRVFQIRLKPVSNLRVSIKLRDNILHRFIKNWQINCFVYVGYQRYKRVI